MNVQSLRLTIVLQPGRIPTIEGDTDQIDRAFLNDLRSVIAKHDPNKEKLNV